MATSQQTKLIDINTYTCWIGILSWHKNRNIERTRWRDDDRQRKKESNRGISYLPVVRN